jgi:glycosyltransferase involved in cell wall biosynthesis
VKPAGRRLRVLLVSPFHGGSHAAWGAGLAQHSAHDVEVVGLPSRFWKWRMQGAALALAPRVIARRPPDLVLATDMLDLSVFLALTRDHLTGVPTALYMHENQLTYPPRAGASGGDRHHGLINLNSMAAAHRVIFNSEFHRTAWFDALPAFLARFPEALDRDLSAELRCRTEVIPVGIETADLPPATGYRRPVVLWNQRWEYDKNPAALMQLLTTVADRGVDFEVVLCGEQADTVPAELARGIETLGPRVVHQGFLPRPQYTRWLGECRVVVSTAHHEFFGISVVEAACAGALPLVPARLSYPEVIGPRFADDCLYADFEQAVARLSALLQPADPTRAAALGLAAELRQRFAWTEVARDYDASLARLAGVPA